MTIHHTRALLQLVAALATVLRNNIVSYFLSYSIWHEKKLKNCQSLCTSALRCCIWSFLWLLCDVIMLRSRDSWTGPDVFPFFPVDACADNRSKWQSSTSLMVGLMGTRSGRHESRWRDRLEEEWVDRRKKERTNVWRPMGLCSYLFERSVPALDRSRH